MRRSISHAAHDAKILGYLAFVPGFTAGMSALIVVLISILEITDSRPPVPWFGKAVCTGIVVAISFGWLAAAVRKCSTYAIGIAALMFWIGVSLPVWWASDGDLLVAVALCALVPILAWGGWAWHIARRLRSSVPEYFSRPHATRRLSLPRDARVLRALGPALLGCMVCLWILVTILGLAPLLRLGAVTVALSWYAPQALRYFRRVRAVLALRAQEVRLEDRRSPVLLLRSFADDELVMKRTKVFLIHVTKTGLSLEEQIVAQLWEVGPVVAIGQPGLNTDPIGAAREHIDGPAWQARVQALIGESALVVVVLGQTAGLFWEYEQLARCVVSVLVILPPGDSDALVSRWQRFAAAYPPARSVVLGEASELPLLIWFRADTEPLIVSGQPRDERSYEFAFASLMGEMGSPIY